MPTRLDTKLLDFSINLLGNNFLKINEDNIIISSGIDGSLKSIFEIFTNVKSVQENTYAFMAGGVQDDEKAKQSIEASNRIAARTEELRDTQ